MAFSLHVDGRGSERASSKSTLSAKATLIVLAIAFGAFCAYDLSPSGQGYVGSSLGHAQRSVQGFVGSFKLKM